MGKFGVWLSRNRLAWMALLTQNLADTLLAKAIRYHSSPDLKTETTAEMHPQTHIPT
jgi:hypothetical protein